jgi:putative tryptophan/tyrosine transport system substrate-binding protein
MKRRDFIALLGGAAAAWPLAARAQQGALPVIAFVSALSVAEAARYDATFRKGLNGRGIIEAQNATIEYHWLDGQYERLPSLMADLSRRVALIATPGSLPAALAAKAVTATIPIVFSGGVDPVQAGLVSSLSRPEANLTGINFFTAEVTAKRLGLLHELLPKAMRIAVLINPRNPTNTATALRELPEAARALGLEIQVLNAGTIPEIDEAFASLARERADALFVGPESYLASRRVQLATLAARHAIPTTFAVRDGVEAGGLMSYGTDIADTYRQVGDYAGRILKGAKPADLPVLQSTKFELVLNLTTARLLGVTVPPDMLTSADEVIE